MKKYIQKILQWLKKLFTKTEKIVRKVSYPKPPLHELTDNDEELYKIINGDIIHIIKYFTVDSYKEQQAYKAYKYADCVIHGRWEKGEPFIAQSSSWSFHYAYHVLRGRFILGEDTIFSTHDSSRAYNASTYMNRIAKQHLPHAVFPIAHDKDWFRYYRNDYGLEKSLFGLFVLYCEKNKLPLKLPYDR